MSHLVDIETIVLRHYTGRVKHIDWEANSIELQHEELCEVRDAAKKSLRTYLHQARLTLCDDAGRVRIRGSNYLWYMEVPVFSFARTATISGGERNRYASTATVADVGKRIDAAVAHETALNVAFPPNRVTCGILSATGGIVGSLFAKNKVGVAVCGLIGVALIVAEPVLRERDMILDPKRHLDKEMMLHTASYLRGVADYQLRRHSYWQYLRAAWAHDACFKRMTSDEYM